MFTKTDCLTILTELDDREQIENFRRNGITPDIVKFISDHKPLDINNFYIKLRKSYNAKRSQLYGNIVKEKDDIDTVLTTLASLQLQILLFAKTVTDRNSFLKHARLDEISYCIYNYSKTADLIPCIKILHLVKADCKFFEHINKM